MSGWRWEFWRPTGYTYYRLGVPPSTIIDWDAEVTVEGGPGQAIIRLAVPLSESPVTLGDRVDLYLDGEIVYQGWIREVEDESGEAVRLVADGYTDLLERIVLPTDYAAPLGTIRDAAAWAKDWIVDRAMAPPIYLAIYYDIGTISTVFTSASCSRRSVKSFLQDLAKVHSKPVVWGLYPKSGGAAPSAWFVFREQEDEVEYQVPLANVISISEGASADVINAVRVVGSGLGNLVRNPDFRQVIIPTSLSGNLLQDGSFERPGPVRNYGTYPSSWWSYGGGNNPSRWRTNNQRYWFLKSRTGDFLLELDAQNEYVQQDVPASPGNYLVGFSYAGGVRDQAQTAPVLELTVQALDSGGSVISTPLTQQVTVQTPAYSTISWNVTLPSGTAKARIKIRQTQVIHSPNVALVDDVIFAPATGSAQEGWTIWRGNSPANAPQCTIDWSNGEKDSPIGGGVVKITVSGASTGNPVYLLPSEDAWISIDRGSVYAVRGIVCAYENNKHIKLGIFYTRGADDANSLQLTLSDAITISRTWNEAWTYGPITVSTDSGEIAPCIAFVEDGTYYVSYVGCWVETSRDPFVIFSRPIFIGNQAEWYFRADDQNVIWEIRNLLDDSVKDSIAQYGLREETFDFGWITTTEQAKQAAARIINTYGKPRGEGSVTLIPTEPVRVYSTQGVRRTFVISRGGGEIEEIVAEVVKYRPAGDQYLVEATKSLRSWDPITRILEAVSKEVSSRPGEVTRVPSGGDGGGGVIEVTTYQVENQTIGQELTVNFKSDTTKPGLSLSGAAVDDKIEIYFGVTYGTSAGTVAEGNHLHDDRYSQLGHTHSHADLTGVTADQHHAQVHSFTGSDHSGISVSSPSAGQVLRYNGSIWANAQLSHSDLTGVTTDQHHAQVHGLDSADHTGTLSWGKVNKTGSSLTDIATRNHNDLQSIQGGASGEYYHLTQSQLSGLTGGGSTSLHLHDDRYGQLAAANTWTAVNTFRAGSLYLQSEAAGWPGILAELYNDTSSYYPFIGVHRARGTISSPAPVSSGDAIGSVNYYARTSAGWQLGAWLYSEIESVATDIQAKLTLGLRKSDGSSVNVATYQVSQVSVLVPTLLINPTSDVPVLRLNSGSGSTYQWANIEFAHSGTRRWNLTKVNNSTVDLGLGRYDSSGAFQGYALYVKGDSGIVGVNTSSPSAGQLMISNSTLGRWGIYITDSVSITSSGTSYDIGLNADARKAISSGVTDSGYIIGIVAGGWVGTAGSIAASYGARLDTGTLSSSSTQVTNAYGARIRVLNQGSSSGAVISSGYGVYIDDVQASTGFGVYQAGTDDKNYFAGSVGVKTSSPNVPLEVVDTVRVSRSGAPSTYLEIFGGSSASDPYLNWSVGDFTVRYSGTEYIIVKSDGKVGIGRVPTMYRLELNGDLYLTGNIFLDAGKTVDGVDVSGHASNADAHHPRVHDFTGSDHTGISVSSPSAGQVLRYNGTAWANAQLSHSDLSGITADQHHAQVHALDGSDHMVSTATYLNTRLYCTGPSMYALVSAEFSSNSASLMAYDNAAYFHSTASSNEARIGAGSSSPFIYFNRTEGDAEITLDSSRRINIDASGVIMPPFRSGAYTNYWSLGGFSAGAVTPTGYFTVTVDGAAYRIPAAPA